MNRKKIKIFSIIAGFILLIAGACGATVYYYLLYPQFRPEKTVYMYIDSDDNLDSVYHKLKNAGNPRSMTGFKWMVNKKNYGSRIRTGRYAVKPRDDAYHLFNRLSAGIQTPMNLTINGVRTRDALARTISNQLMIDSASIASRLYDPVFCEQIGYKEETIVSLFIPNTYEVYWNMNVDELFSRMQKEHKRFWNDERLAKAKNIGMTPEEVCTLASIVEEETNNASERPMVAGLYMNRLKKGMLLQADPTVKFGVGDFGLRRITNQHLQVNSPYNTYKYTGLPPGPIRIPSRKSMDSVLNYTKHNYLYMCAKEDFSGTHNFATNLKDHMANARKYWKALNERKIF